jgi:predicted RNase H-like nuclease (RuvC/YqgF family)
MCVVLVAAASWARAEDSRAATYTNDDLVRVAPLRGQTGVTSVPAFRPSERQAEKTAETRGEAYWRAEADKLQGDLRRFRREGDSIRGRLETLKREAREAAFRASRSPRAPNRGDNYETRIGALQDQLRRLDQELREREARLEERARREGALPGWIR